MRPTPIRRPSYTNEIGMRQVGDLFHRGLKNKYGHDISEDQLKKFFREHKELSSGVHKNVAQGILHKRRSGTIKTYQAKSFLRALGTATRAGSQEAVTKQAQQTMKQSKKLQEQSEKLARAATQQQSEDAAARQLKESKELAAESARLAERAEEQKGATVLRITKSGREMLSAPKQTLRGLTDARLEEMTPKGPTKEELAQQEQIHARRMHMRQYDNTEGLRREINRLFGAREDARTSIIDSEIVDFHKNAQTTATDKDSIQTSVSDFSGKSKEPLGSASELTEKETHVNPQHRATSSEESDEELDDNLPLAA